MARSYITTQSYHPCPCCGYRVFQVGGINATCPICAWQDSVEQLLDPYRVSEPNWISLYDAQLSYLRCGVSQIEKAELASTPMSYDVRDKKWRPIQSSDSFGTVERRSALKVDDYHELFYWLDEFWNSKHTYMRRLQVSALFETNKANNDFAMSSI